MDEPDLLAPRPLQGGSIARERESALVLPPLVTGELNMPTYALSDGYSRNGVKRNVPGTIVPAVTLGDFARYVEIGVLNTSADEEFLATHVSMGTRNVTRDLVTIDTYHQDTWLRLVGRGGGTDDEIAESRDNHMFIELTGPLDTDGELVKYRLASHTLPGVGESPDVGPPAPTGCYAERGGVDDSVAKYDGYWLPREAWLVLRHRHNLETVADDTARVTIAPFIFSADIDPPQRLYAYHIPDQEHAPGNFGFLWDIFSVARSLGVEVEGWDFFNAMGGWVLGRGVFVQDYHLFGYTTTPNVEVPKVYYTTRVPHATQPDVLRPHEVEADVPSMSFRPEVFEQARDSLNFGGNIVVSPPVAEPTDQLDATGRHPRIRAHPAAPYGKLIVGASTNEHPYYEFRAFLKNQRVQPIVAIDTTWLEVKHSDEVVSFAMGPNGPIMFLAAPDVAVTVLHRLVANGATIRRPARNGGVYDHSLVFDRSAAGLLQAASGGRLVLEHGVQVELPSGDVTVTRATLPRDQQLEYMAKLDTVHTRLTHALRIGMDNTIGVPVLFSPGADVKALLPNMVNFQLLGTHMLVPKPWGPRVDLNHAMQALVEAGVSEDLFENVQPEPLMGEEMWLMPNQSVQDLAVAMGVEDDAIEVIGTREDHQAFAYRSQPSGDAIPWPEGWRRVRITHTSVCIFEALMAVMLGGSGLTLHFIDDWRTYHSSGAGGSMGGGEVHCGTNVARLAPHVADVWWESARYQRFIDVEATL